MAQFSAKERLIASVLSATPGLKSFVKQVYVRVNALIYRKGYRSRVNDMECGEIFVFEPRTMGDETFYGYYDKSPESVGGLVVMNETRRPTSSKPTAGEEVEIVVSDGLGCNPKVAGRTRAYNWQQGARAMWLDGDSVVFNVFDGTDYRAAVYSVKAGKVVREYDRPVQDAYGNEFFLSVNYRRIMRLRPDYGYRNLPLPSEAEMRRLGDDGIWRVDCSTGVSELLFSLADVAAVGPSRDYGQAMHKVNHLMISPDGSGFIFIHRWYQGRRRFDRLVYSDFKSMRVLADEGMVSHMCWVDNVTLFGYFRHEGRNGFWYVDVPSGRVTECVEATGLMTGDGHPSAWGDWIVFDSYPDKSRMQHLFIMNRRTGAVRELLEVYQSVRYSGETRCDLHPRFSPDGKFIYFDSVFTGGRRLCRVDVSNITRQ